MEKIEIFDEDNCIVLEDQYGTTDFQIYPKDKKFIVNRSSKEDCFFSKQIIEYKISTNPIEIQMRTLEHSSEPPKKYSIKDGVVLESELKNDFKKMGALFSDRIKELQEEVEWSKVDILGNYAVNLFILSKHPKIISKEEYRKILRQNKERMKTGIHKIKDYLKEKDKTGLQIVNGEFGRHIWYSDDKKMSEAEEKKRLIYIDKIYKDLFDKKSSNYCNLLNSEFTQSLGIIKHLNKILNKKEVITASTSIKKKKHESNNMKWTVVALVSVIALYWGVWTAIGVFILGNIFVTLLSSNRNNV